MSILLAAFAASLVVTLLAVRISGKAGHSALDADIAGPQKFHAAPVPRIGGVGILGGALAGVFVLAWTSSDMAEKALVLVACGMPAFMVGLHEDLTKAISPRRRLAATALSALLAAAFAGGVIDRTGIPGIDWIVSFGVGALMLTIFAVAGVANSVNIIDGFNGLASMCSVIILASLSYVAFQVGDPLITALALIGAGAILGFFIWNFPAGLIFLGDGGAYFVGFYVAEVAILLLHRNPSVSPMFPLLVCIYPIFETIFSIYRRRFIRATPPSMPDGIHLHSLIYRRLMRWAVGNKTAKSLTRRNSMTSPYLWLLCMFSVVPAVALWNNTTALALCIALFALIYVAMYWRIVRFKTPRWLVYRRHDPHKG
jgi:UDP-N-acetylmuramyl pentapeptide phosphotransferase/UDP-N-acetylglucosamine-1-phosphate transferase